MKNFAFLLFCFFFINNLTAQLSPVKWEYSTKKIADDEFEVVFTARVDNGWNIYSQHTEAGGPSPTSINFEENGNFEFIGEITETGKKKEAFDDLFGVNVIKFIGDVVFTQKIKVKNDGNSVKGYLEFMCCDGEKCLPPTEVDFDIDLK